MANQTDRPSTGDMYRCTKCNFEVHITSGCVCKDCTTKLECCNQSLEKMTATSVQDG